MDMMTKAISDQRLTIRDGLDLYFQEIHKTPLLSRKEERRLAERWFFEKDPEAAKQLVVSNLRFAAKIAFEYSRYGFRMADLVQEGNLGLLHAVQRFDPRRGYRLITYAVWWIRAYIQAFILRSWSVVRTGTTRVQRRIFSSLQKARKKILSLTHGEEPSQAKLAEALDVSEEELAETVNRLEMRDVSLDQPMTRESSVSLGDSLATENPTAEAQIITADLRNKVRETLDHAYEDLTPRERYLLNHRLLSDQPITLEAAGHEFGVTRERARQLEERLKGKLKKALSPALGLEIAPQAG